MMYGQDVWAEITLSTAGNVGSIIGALFTLIAFFAQIKKRQKYSLLLRGPELQENLIEAGKRLNKYDSLSSQEMKTVVTRTRTHVAYAARYLSWGEWWSLWPTRLSMRFCWKAVGNEMAENYYAKVQSAIVDLENRIRDLEVKQ